MEVPTGQHYQGRPHQVQNGAAERLARGLGWFSIALGMVEVTAPASIAHLVGASDDRKQRELIRFYGLREIASGIGILSQERPNAWIWSRVAGDLVDLASLGSVLKSNETNRTRTAMATAAVLGVAALDLYCSQRLQTEPVYEVKTITINRLPADVYSFFRDIEHCPKLIDHFRSLQATDQQSRWRVKIPGGSPIQWNAEITHDEPNSQIDWRSTSESDIDHAGSVRFERATGGRGTLVRVEIEYVPPGGALAAQIAKLFGAEPGQQIERALRLIKQILETGDIVRSESSIHPGMHPARPPAYSEREQAAGERQRGSASPRRMAV
ncbi:MAG TPA: SRPBCC family protein [Thermodesulfobacteriota bacterium]|nr:SRPBCC family protein [Deltaproteobacteria bacterium]HNR13222.1 SRPBCC family protein [Thermodesulfobacteriota bacterium]HNU70867.1 SRPBCC family protein [Thermodesulfobacteriota bacterium]